LSPDLVFLFQIVLLFLGSAFFSGSEVAIFSLDKKKLDQYYDKSSIAYKYIVVLLEFPKRLLITILIGNTLLNVVASFLSAFYALQLIHRYNIPISNDVAITIEVVILTITLLIFGEISPKVLSAKNPVFISKIASIPLYWINVIFYPIAETINEVTKALLSKFHIKRSAYIIGSDEISHMVQFGHESGTLEDEEHDIIQGLISSKTTRVREIMTHRVDINSISVDQSFLEIVEIVKNSGHSRLPVCKDNLDEIVGVLYAKDLLVYISKENSPSHFSLKNIIRQPLIVPETKLINELMRDFQDKKSHLAIVVDEYGGTSGLVTLEDIIQEIVGDIGDENTQGDGDITKLPNGTLLILGSTPIDKVVEELQLNLDISDTNYDTLAGWVLDYKGKIPKAGYSFTYEGLKFIIREVINNKISLVLVEKLKQKNSSSI
jgi:gliding motility-associated protein GldE